MLLHFTIKFQLSKWNIYSTMHCCLYQNLVFPIDFDRRPYSNDMHYTVLHCNQTKYREKIGDCTLGHGRYSNRVLCIERHKDRYPFSKTFK